MLFLCEYVFIAQVRDCCISRILVQLLKPRCDSNVSDEGFFSFIKSLMKRFHFHVIVHNLCSDLQERDNMRKCQSYEKMKENGSSMLLNWKSCL